MTEPKKSIADSLDVKPHDEGLAASADRAFSNYVPIAGDAWKSIKGVKETIGDVDEVGDLDDAAKEMASNGAAFIGGCYADAAFFAMDPIGYLVGAGLNMLLELVQPLQDALHYVTGDGPSLSAAADNFAQIGEGFVALADDFDTTGDKALKDWQEQAGNAAREALADFSIGIQGVGSVAGSVSEVLKTWSLIMTVIEEVIKGIITELVSWLITLWLPALAASVISFGSSVAAAMTASIAKVASVFTKVSKHLGKLGKLLDQLGKILVKINGGVVKLAAKFRMRRSLDTASSALMQDLGRFTGENAFKTGLKTMGGSLGSLGKGTAAKAGVGAAKAGWNERDSTVEAAGDTFGDDDYYDTDVGGNQNPEDTHGNLQM